MDRKDGNHFILDHHHQIVLLEACDDLGAVASQITGSLMVSANFISAEYVEKHRLSDGSNMYKIALMPDNECMTIIFAQASILEAGIEDLLRSRCSSTADELILRKLKDTFE